MTLGEPEPLVLSRPAAMGEDRTPAAQGCPVDHETREAWLKQARQHPHVEVAPPTFTAAGDSCSSSTINQPTPPSSTSWRIPGFSRSAPPSALDTQRQVSTIPRTDGAVPSSETDPLEEKSSGKSSAGNWIYPSEQMFFNAMRRKQYDPRAEDMKAIVPIHNAVNERAWSEIKKWEEGKGSEKCGGPRLHSFNGLGANALTPKARLNTLMGYQAPFDRHDWVVDRCGQKIEYVIDFYTGKDDGKGGKSLNFYLDVRPKLNSWEGWKMRLGKSFGL